MQYLAVMNRRHLKKLIGAAEAHFTELCHHFLGLAAYNNKYKVPKNAFEYSNYAIPVTMART
jgi:hypothetical protein